MTNLLRIKRSTTVATPPSLDQGELAYSESTGTGDGELFIGIAGANLEKIGGFKDVQKLLGIEALADVTGNISTTAGISFVIDEDNMVSNLSTKVPTQQSVKAYVDAAVTNGMTYMGGYNASTNSPDLDVSPSGVSVGDTYTVTVAGTFFSALLEVGDTLIAEIDGASVENDWTIVQTNLDAGSIKVLYESNSNTNAFTDSLSNKLGFISVTQAVNLDTMESNIVTNNAKVSNVSTVLSVGTRTGTTFGITSDGSANDVLLSVFNSTQAGLAPSSGGGGVNYLRADGTWAAPPGGSASLSFETMTVTDTDSGFSWSGTGSAVADSSTDTLTWVSGAGINIDVDASGDAIRITNTSTGSITNLSLGTISAVNVPILSSDGSDISSLPAATSALAGIVVNGAQAFGGTKTFDDISGANAGAVLDSFIIDGGTF